jgi:tripartite-type tricarboxylate transporter receptor subunit TctC
MFRGLVAVAIVATTLIGTAASAVAQDTFPNRLVKIIIPVPPGSAPDVIARLVAVQLTGIWHQQVIVENRPGGSGLIAAQAVAGSRPDGYSLLYAITSIYTILPAQKERLPIDVNRDFIPIGLMGGGSMYIAVPPRLGVSTLAEFIALARSRPREIVVGTNGVGTLPYFAARALAKMGNVPITIAPYATGGTMDAIKDIMGGRVHATVDAMSGLQGALDSGDLRLIAVMSPERAAILPNLPTAGETVPGLNAVGFMSLAAPVGTPELIIRRLSEGLHQALEAPAVKERLMEFDMQRPFLTPEQTTSFIESEEKFWWPLVREIDSN